MTLGVDLMPIAASVIAMAELHAPATSLAA